jgi:hypothetical protein
MVGLSIGLGHEVKSDWSYATAALIAISLIFASFVFHSDHELLFGCFTIFTALAAISVFIAFFSYHSVENYAAAVFLALIVLGVTALTLIAHDWARRPFMVAAIIVAAGLSLFIVRIGFESLKVPPQWNRSEIVDRTRVAEQFLHAQNKKVSTLALDRQICVIAGTPSTSKTSDKCGPPNDMISSNTAWVIDKHQLDIDLAQYRFSVTKASADGTAAQKVLDQQPDVDQNISILSAIENGPDALWRSATHSAGPALVPGPLGWVIFGAIALGLLAWWVKVNASQLAGPVVLPEVAADAKDEDKDLNTVLRVAILRNLPEPGASPGSDSINPVTNLLDIAGGPLAPISKILQTVLAVTGRRYGYQIEIDVAGADPGSTATGPSASPGTASASPGTTSALIRVMTVSGGATLRTRMCSSSQAEEAVRTAGLWAAGFILARSTRIPGWAAWNAETAHALAVAGDQDSLNTDILQDALKGAPDSGILLCLLGHYYELEGEDLKALNCYARAVAAHPRYPVARYRLAATIASLRYYDDSQPITLDDLRVLRLAIIAQKVNVANDLKSYLDETTKVAPDAAGFAKLAEVLLQRLARDMRYRFQWVSALRRSERDYVWRGLKPSYSTAASRFHQAVKSAHWATQAAPAGAMKVLAASGSIGGAGGLPAPEAVLSHEISWPALGHLYRAACKPDSWWQISYNAACAYASCVPVDPSQSDTALELLEQTLIHPGIHQLTADWVRTDPDLRPISRTPRFGRFVDQLRSGA